MNPVTSRRLLLLAGASLIAPQGRAQLIDAAWDRPLDWTRNFRVGMQLGLNIKAKFTTSGTYQITPNPGTDNGFTFDNGYVRTDVSGSTDGYTWNWGYNSADQYNPVDHTLNFRSTSSYEVNGGQSATKKDNPYLGFDLAYGWAFTRWGEAKIG